MSLCTYPDANRAASVNDFSAVINWGDDSSSQGTVSEVGMGLYAVNAPHTYTQLGSFTVQVNITDAGGATTLLSDTVTVTNPPLPYTPGTPTFIEGATPATQPLATFTDPDGNTDPTKYNASIDWGDTSPTSIGTLTWQNGSFRISGTHGYVEDGQRPLTITLSDYPDNLSEPIPLTATIGDAVLTAAPQSLAAAVGTPYSGVVAKFTDANPGASQGDYSAVIDWGDGTSTSLDGSVITAASGGGWQVSGSHTYATAGSYNVIVAIRDAGGASATTTSIMTVGGASQTLVVNPLVFTESQLFSGVVATYTPPTGSNGSYTATIGWGDGQSSTGTLTANGNSWQISGVHTYTDETPAGQPYTLTVSVQPAPGTSGIPQTGSAFVSVNDAVLTPTPLTLTGWSNQSGSQVVGQFTDANLAASASDFTASINWGDGSTATAGTVQAASGGGWQVTGGHSYTTTGTFPVTITVTDDGGQTTVINSSISVGTTTASLTTSEGVSYNGAVASFTGDATKATSASIDWGDKTTPTTGTITSTGSNSFTVSGSHLYTDEGSFPLNVTVQMSQGGPLTASGPATVQDATLTATGVTLTATPGQPLATPPAQVVVATFSDANPQASLSDFTASIAWGDGSTSTGTVQLNGSTWQVLGEHTYQKSGTFTAVTTITDKGGKTATANSTITVGSANPPDVVEGSDYALSLQVAAPGSTPSASGSYTASIDWGDGTSTTGTVNVVSGSSPLQLLVTGDHVYSEEGSYSIQVTASDANGNKTNTSGPSLTVGDASLSGSGQNVSGTAGSGLGTVQFGGGTSGAVLGSFTDANSGASVGDFTVSINWGDGSSTDTTSGQVKSVSGGGWQVTANHTYTTAGAYTITTTVTDDGGSTTTFTSTATISGPWNMIGSQTGQRTNDPDKALLVPVGEASVDLNQGALRLSHSLDFDQSPGTSVGGSPALVYNSATANVLPVIQLAVQGDPNAPAANQAVVVLTWNGVAQTPVTYNLFQQAGSVYQFAVQPNSAVATSGSYNWSATVTFTLSDNSTRQATASGTATVVSRAGSAHGAGWGIDGISQLVVSAAGALMVTGQGDSRFFASNGSGGFTSPAEDFGTLTHNGGGYLYTAKDQTQLNYNSAGYLTSVVDTHGLATTYQYDGQNRLIQVNAIDGGITTLAYDGTTGLLDTITEPGDRVLTLTHDGSGNLTQITDVDGTTRMFGYLTPSNHLITSDQWAPLYTGFSYNNGLLSQVSPGFGSSYIVTSAASDGLSNLMMGGSSAEWASLTNGDGHTTQYLLDQRGRVLEQIEGDGTSTTTYQLNAAGLVTQTVDPMGRTTLDSYNSSGDLLQETAADGSWTQYQ